MATLPDLDQSKHDMVAYWNAIDQGGANEISPSEAASNGKLVETTLYDNGFVGEYNPNGNTRNLTVRVKSDGWIVAARKRGETYKKDQTSPMIGKWSFLDNWDHPQYQARPDQNVLSKAINNLRSEFGNSAGMDFSHSDVGLFDFENPDATNLTSLWGSLHNESDGDMNSNYGSIRTSGTNVVYESVLGAAKSDRAYESKVSFEGVTLAQAPYDSQLFWGSLDVLYQSLAPEQDTEYIASAKAGGIDGSLGGVGKNSTASVSHLILWN